MREIYDALQPALAFVTEALLLALVIFAAMGVWIRLRSEAADERDLVDMGVLVIVAALAWTAYVR